ncbi:MAG: isoaspartyl peptidase/L-asparaginase [Chloroflexi bacterium]|nr:isoaspartyl peptidase/L-asparaginase [Chloroflexota bacterium]
MQPTIIVHGGAGLWDLASGEVEIGMAACKEAAEVGQRILRAGGRALDAVEAAVRILEDCPVLDAGVGSYLTNEGKVEMDALIMDGRTLALGCVAAVERVRYPISLARQVMEKTEHTILVAEGASKFADAIGFPRCTAEELIVDDEQVRHQYIRELGQYQPSDLFVTSGSMGDTVGAVALDSFGDLAAATSTGGTRNQMPGRVGDSPLVGSGGYADNLSGAVSSTGHGESLMKVVISKQACDFMALGMSATAACEAAIKLLAQRMGAKGKGGLIGIDKSGRVGFYFNTDAMPYAFIVGDGAVVTGR